VHIEAFDRVDLDGTGIDRITEAEVVAVVRDALNRGRGGRIVTPNIDILRRAQEAEVTCVLKQEDDGTYRVSLRSLGEVDVRRVAEAHGGGGHRFAAGFNSELDLDTLVARIAAAL